MGKALNSAGAAEDRETTLLKKMRWKTNVIGPIALILGLGFTGCDGGDPPLFIKKWLGWFPVEETIVLEADGKPLKISRTIECRQWMCWSSACFASFVWGTKGQSPVVEKLPSGGVVLVETYGVCKDGELNPAKSNNRVHKVGWADDPKRPTIVQTYDVGAIFATKFPDKEQRISVRNMSIKYRRIGWKNAKVDPPVSTRDLHWFNGRWGLLDELNRNPLQLAGLNAVGYPEEIWSELEELRGQLSSITKPQRVIVDKTQVSRLNSLWKDIKFKMNRARSSREMIPQSLDSTPWVASFRHLGQNQWQLRSTSTEYSTKYLVGRKPLKGNQEIFIGEEKLKVSAGDFVFDPISKMLMKMSSVHHTSIYNVK